MAIVLLLKVSYLIEHGREGIGIPIGICQFGVAQAFSCDPEQRSQVALLARPVVDASIAVSAGLNTRIGIWKGTSRNVYCFHGEVHLSRQVWMLGRSAVTSIGPLVALQSVLKVLVSQQRQLFCRPSDRKSRPPILGLGRQQTIRSTRTSMHRVLRWRPFPCRHTGGRHPNQTRRMPVKPFLSH